MDAPDRHGGEAEIRSLDALKIDLDELELGTQPLAVELPVAWLQTALAQTDAIVERPGVARLEVMIQADRTVLVRGSLELVYAVPCARCLAPAPVDVGAETGELCVTFVPADRLRSWAEFTGAPEDEDEIEPLDPSELDEIGYEGSSLDLRELVSEQILLAYPMRALCDRQEACRGLCMRCGADLNAIEPGGEGPERCPACGLRLDGVDEDTAETPWKKALSKLKSED